MNGCALDVGCWVFWRQKYIARIGLYAAFKIEQDLSCVEKYSAD